MSNKSVFYQRGLEILQGAEKSQQGFVIFANTSEGKFHSIGHNVSMRDLAEFVVNLIDQNPALPPVISAVLEAERTQ